MRNNNDPRVRAERKLFYQQIGSNNSVARFNHIQEAEVGRFLVRVRDNPEGLQDHIRKYVCHISSWNCTGANGYIQTSSSNHSETSIWIQCCATWE